MRVNKYLETMLIVSTLLVTSLVTSLSTSSDAPETSTLKLTSPTTVTSTQEPSTTDEAWSSTSQQPTTVSSTTTTTMKTTTATASSTSTSTPSSTSTSFPSTSTYQPTSVEWKDMDEAESQELVDFVVAEIQKLKVEHKELDDCQELNLSSVLSGKKLGGKIIKYSVTLKVQPQMKNIEACIHKNDILNNMHPEICEADVTQGDRGKSDEKTLLRSTCLQVEELQD